MKNKSDLFKKQLEKIQDDNIRYFTTYALDNADDYFFTVSSSSTNKFHPQCSLGLGGLMRHVKGGLMILEDLLNLEMFESNDYEKDLCRCAFTLHDIKKQGDGASGYTQFTHPFLAAEYIQKCNNELGDNKLDDEDIEFLCGIVSCHMGQWNTSSKNKTILPKPTTMHQYLIHLADYISSRKYLECQFDEDEILYPEVDINTYVLSFGKHKDKLLIDVARTDKGYLEWLYINCNIQEPLVTFIKDILEI